MLPVSVDCLILIVPSILSDVYYEYREDEGHQNELKKDKNQHNKKKKTNKDEGHQNELKKDKYQHNKKKKTNKDEGHQNELKKDKNQHNKKKKTNKDETDN
jgi:hypothetical protein